VRRAAVVVLGALVGLAAGAVWTLLQSDEYRADARVLVRPASAHALPAVEALAESSLIATNIAQTLHLSAAPHISAKRGGSGVLTVSAEAGSRERARQIDAEALVILEQKVQQRFATVHASATVLDPAHVARQTSPTAGRNLLITGLAGLLVGLAVSTALSPRARRERQAQLELEQRLQARIGHVSKRERMLAQRAGQLAAREHDLGRREEEGAVEVRRRDDRLAQRQRELERRESELETRAAELETGAAELETRAAELDARAAEPEPVPEPAPLPEPELLPAVRTGWDLQALEKRVAARADAGPAQQQEWEAYLFYLRQHADHDGKLPATFDGLVAEVFGVLSPPREP
jgi:capsular polysaccharide biosynthesis protein